MLRLTIDGGWLRQATAGYSIHICMRMTDLIISPTDSSRGSEHPKGQYESCVKRPRPNWWHRPCRRLRQPLRSWELREKESECCNPLCIYAVHAHKQRGAYCCNKCQANDESNSKTMKLDGHVPCADNCERLQTMVHPTLL